MKVIDLTKNYLNYLKNNDLEEYTDSYPSLFDHYFSFWGDRESFRGDFNSEKIDRNLSLIIAKLPYIEAQFKKSGLDLTNLEIILFIGQGTTNGHSFKKNNKFVVWIPVEPYDTEIKIDAFLSHEIIHGLHYGKQPSFYFANEDEKYNAMRQLVTEGLATYLTTKVMNISEERALWGDFLDPIEASRWINECKDNKRKIAEYILSDNPKFRRGLFEANDDRDIFNYRAGYYLGYTLIKEIAEENDYSPLQLIELPKEDVDSYTKKKLHSI